jgi:HrpA-like RNA helicase
MAAVPAHPRLSHMVLRAQALEAPELGCLLASLLSERDLFRAGGSSSEQRSADLAARLRVLLGQGGSHACTDTYMCTLLHVPALLDGFTACTVPVSHHLLVVSLTLLGCVMYPACVCAQTRRLLGLTVLVAAGCCWVDTRWCRHWQQPAAAAVTAAILTAAAAVQAVTLSSTQ